MFETANTRMLGELLRRSKDAFLDQMRFNVLGHFDEKATNLVATLNGKLEAD